MLMLPYHAGSSRHSLDSHQLKLRDQAESWHTKGVDLVRSMHCYSTFTYGAKLMSNSDLLPTLLSKIYENQLALEAAIMELSNWVDQRGSSDIAENVRGALTAIDRNEEFIKLTLAVLMTPE